MNMWTGKGGFINFHLDILKSIADYSGVMLTKEELKEHEDRLNRECREGAYSLDPITGAKFEGYYIESEDGYKIVQHDLKNGEYKYYLDQISNGFGVQVKEITKEELDKIMKEHVVAEQPIER